MDQQTYKEVYYHKYCKTCKHEKLKETEAELENLVDFGSYSGEVIELF